MSYNQALSAYRETRVRTASQGSLIVMLYEEAIKQLGAAIELMDDDFRKNTGRIELINNHILKTQEIITELMASLNMEAGEIAANLLALYTYFNQQLIEANIEKKPEKLQFIRNMMDQLRQAWAEAVNTTANTTPAQKAPAGIDIAG
ncbi:flagellar export chaperone FliS [Brucepastera parasyntrophica]|uniref:flagellar export chaperone FliS n=1 Tax=Brucepastera parasyntrophica TaxID=2880008 RepID=UPI00210995A1|nr:flagellar export chaperone FliS [Brucepastera parasyntrophica]ULQ60744.1 flagellar export chaperone FliS [Brucepastera parasyntrophica]